MTATLEQGATNCVVQCAKIDAGQEVFLVNQEGAVEPAVVDAIEATIRDHGARVSVIWGKRITQKSRAGVPDDVFAAYRDGEVVVSHFPSFSRAMRGDYFKDEIRTRVRNRAFTADFLASEWAQFPFELQRKISQQIDVLLSPGTGWRLTTPLGTDLRGVVGDPEDSAVASGYFLEGDDGTRAGRNFPGGVHMPKMALDVNGVLVAEHVDCAANYEDFEPIRFELKDSKVISVDGPEENVARVEAVLDGTDRITDSFHSGINPKAFAPCSRAAEPQRWWEYARNNPDMLHFHLGRARVPVSAAVFGYTLTADERVICRDGQFEFFDEPALASEIARLNVADGVLTSIPLRFA